MIFVVTVTDLKKSKDIDSVQCDNLTEVNRRFKEFSEKYYAADADGKRNEYIQILVQGMTPDWPNK